MSGLILRLAGPLQSWGEHSLYTDRDTLRHPTRSGITGLLACAQGIRRRQPLDRYDPLAITIRVDRPGAVMGDFHTAGGGLPRERSIPTAAGTRRLAGLAIAVTRRWYLSDAVFTVAVEGPAPLIGEIASALAAPRWQPYLGRRSCPPDQPLLLRVVPGDPGSELRGRVPLPARQAPPDGTGQVTVDMITEVPVPGAQVTEVSGMHAPAGGHRDFASRLVYRAAVQVPAALASWAGAAAYHQALSDYARSAG